MSNHGSKRAEMHPYLRGYNFWNENRYWHNSTIAYTKRFKEQSDKWVDDMQQNIRSLAAVDKTLK